MCTIWKFPVPVSDEFPLVLPTGAQFLSVQTQGTLPQMWFLLDPKARPTHRRFAVFGTGHVIEDLDRLAYLGTFQMNGGSLVFHLFERR
jgi:hypothetical protein